MGIIPEYQIAQIKESVDLVELINGFVQLKRKGRSFFGKCPFHEEADASFAVFSASQHYKCFGCGKSGDAFNFLMEIQGIDFPTAVKSLADRVGIIIEEQKSTSIQKQNKSKKQRIYQALTSAMEFYHDILRKNPSARSARKYLNNRGFTKETLLEYKIGYALNSWDSLLKFLSKDYSLDELEQASLITKTRNQGHVDYFKNRIMFPFLDSFGKVIGFGGRTLDANNNVKYLNTKTTWFFEKQKTLYLLNQAREKIRKKDEAIIVEGYTDALMAHQEGLKNSVATAGTALTRNHALLLKRLSEKAILCFDSDKSGIESAINAGLLLLNADLRVKTVLLSKNTDPAEFFLNNPDEAKNAFQNPISLFEFTINYLLHEKELCDPYDKSKILKELAPLFRAAPDAITSKAYIHAASEKLQIPFEAAVEAVSYFEKKHFMPKISPFPTEEIEFKIASCLLRKPWCRNELALNLESQQFNNPEIQLLFSYFQQQDNPKNDLLVSEQRLAKTPSLYDSQYTENLPAELIKFAKKQKKIPDESKIYALISKLQRTHAPDLPVNCLANRLQIHYVEQQLLQIENKIDTAHCRRDPQQLEQLMHKYHENIQKLKSLRRDSLK